MTYNVFGRTLNLAQPFIIWRKRPQFSTTQSEL